MQHVVQPGVLPGQAPQTQNARIGRVAAVWNDGLFAALTTHAIRLLRAEVLSRKGLGVNFDKDELVVVVCAAIRRVVGPFQVMDSLLSNRHVLAHFDLEGTHPEIAQI